MEALASPGGPGVSGDPTPITGPASPCRQHLCGGLGAAFLAGIEAADRSIGQAADRSWSRGGALTTLLP